MPADAITTDSDPLAPLVTRAVAGERAALEGVCRAVQASVYRLALRMLGAVEDAEDSTQEILVLVVTHLSTCNSSRVRRRVASSGVRFQRRSSAPMTRRSSARSP